MSIDARIKAVAKNRKGTIVLYLAPYRHSDGTMSIPGVERLGIVEGTHRPHAGQKIWGDSGRCIVEASQGGARIEYRRFGGRLYEDQP